MPPKLFDRPDYKGQFRAYLRDETRALLAFIKHHWILSGIILIGVVLLLPQSNPIPPSTVVMATGQPNSSDAILGNWYKDFFAANGVTLELVESQGAIDNLKLLNEGKVQAAFGQAGIPAPKDAQLVSLGSIEFQPLWLFYRGKPVEPNWATQLLSKWNISVGLENSGAYFMVKDMLREYGLRPEAYPNLHKLSTKESIEKLLHGDIDAMFLLAGTDSQNLQRLLQQKDLNYWNFRAARATAGRIQYADAVVFPRGAVSLSPVVPAEDVELVATSATIVAKSNLHPAIQYLFMMATEQHYRNTENYFDRPGGFPAFLDQNFKKSPIAVKYIDNHGSLLKYDLPYWLASFIDRAWLTVAALLAILLPLTKLVPQYRKYHHGLIQNSHYGRMFELMISIRGASSLNELSHIVPEFERLAEQVELTWAPVGTKEKYFFMLNAMETMRRHIERKQEQLATDERASA